MPGVLPLSGLQLGVESTAGTAVATTREVYPSATGYFDPGVLTSQHEGAQRGTFTSRTYGTVIGYAPTLNWSTEPTRGLTYDELVIIGSQLESGQTGAGTGADKTWQFVAGDTAATFDTYTWNVFSGTQAYEMDYSFCTGFTISAGNDDLTQMSSDWVGRQTSKVTVDAVTANNAVTIPSGLWTVKYATAQSGLTGASVLANTMRSFELQVDLPQRPRFYNDGALEFGQGVSSTNLEGTLTMVWDDTSDAVTQYDRWLTQSVSFFRLRATGPSLGGSAYQASFDVAVLWDSVTPMASESDGVLEYQLVGNIVSDATWNQSLVLDPICSLAALP